jgi:TonB family protein
LSGLGQAGPKGPDVSGPSGAVQGTGQLDGGQIQSTVARYTGSVKRACWQPALDTRDKDAPTTARVNVAITVLPSGSVSNAAVGGDPKGYRGLSQCISSRVRGWQFPPSGDSTTVNVPFVFAAQ